MCSYVGRVCVCVLLFEWLEAFPVEIFPSNFNKQSNWIFDNQQMSYRMCWYNVIVLYKHSTSIVVFSVNFVIVVVSGNDAFYNGSFSFECICFFLTSTFILITTINFFVLL